MTKSDKNNPFKTGRRTTVGDGGLFLSIKEGESVSFVPLSGLDGMVSAEMHEYWDVKPAIFHPCIGVDCPGCRAGNKARFKGYMPVLMRDGGVKIYAFTTLVYKQLEDLEDALEGNTLKGAALRVKRTGAGKSTRYTVVPTGKKVDVSDTEEPRFVHLLGHTGEEEILAQLIEAGIIRTSPDKFKKDVESKITDLLEEDDPLIGDDIDDEKWAF